jgi:hypothetical protein
MVNLRDSYLQRNGMTRGLLGRVIVWQQQILVVGLVWGMFYVFRGRK